MLNAFAHKDIMLLNVADTVLISAEHAEIWVDSSSTFIFTDVMFKSDDSLCISVSYETFFDTVTALHVLDEYALTYDINIKSFGEIGATPLLEIGFSSSSSCSGRNVFMYSDGIIFLQCLILLHSQRMNLAPIYLEMSVNPIAKIH